jgi:hypothetical protein
MADPKKPVTEDPDFDLDEDGEPDPDHYAVPDALVEEWAAQDAEDGAEVEENETDEQEKDDE